jgi:chloride channel protein, CIC family
VGYAVALGVAGALAGLASLAALKYGAYWFSSTRSGWFDGHWWWVGVTAAAGAAVGFLRRLTRLPTDVPGLFADLQKGSVDPRLVLGTVALSGVSLLGGASVGPEKLLASLGGGAGTALARRRRLGTEDADVTTLAGIAGMFGGLFSSPVIASIMILEVTRPGGQRFSKTLVTNVVAGSVSFGIYFAIAGAVFLGAYPVPRYAFADWQLLAAVPLGLFGALVTVASTGLESGTSRLSRRLALSPPVMSTLGGVLFGVIGVALPLTMFSGATELTSELTGAGALGLGLCVAVLAAKMVTYALCQASGFVGGPIYPSLFIGGAAGIAVHELLPGLPLGWSFSCLLPAVLGSTAAAPFSMVLMAAFLTRAGELQTAPILITVVTTYLGVQGLRYVLARRGSARRPASHQPARDDGAEGFA